jgi:Ras-related GTP-binding protein C/D
MGLRRSGKSSIQKVVFHKMSPNETLFLESTNKVIKNDISNSSFVQFQVWDFPGQLDFTDDEAFNTKAIFQGCGALVFVIDAVEDTYEALAKLYVVIEKAYAINPQISFEVFIHKIDGLQPGSELDMQRDIHTQVTAELEDRKIPIHPSFYLTSIYDHSIFEAFSKVVQRLIKQLPILENLLAILCTNCRIDKAFLFDVVSKIYIATDASPVDMATYELCSDMIDVTIDISCIYGTSQDQEGIAYDHESSSVMKLQNKTVLYLREVNRCLALVCLLREDSFEKHGLIDYNFAFFRQAITDVFVGQPRPASSATS